MSRLVHVELDAPNLNDLPSRCGADWPAKGHSFTLHSPSPGTSCTSQTRLFIWFVLLRRRALHRDVPSIATPGDYIE